MTSYNSLETSLLNKRPAPTFMSHNMSQGYPQNQAMNFPYNNFSMQQYQAGYYREDQNKNYNTPTTQDPDEFLSEPSKKIKSEKSSEYSYPNGNPTFPYSQINNSQVNSQNNQPKPTMHNMMYQNQNFQNHLASTNQKTWENASSGLNGTNQQSMAVEKPAPKPETNPAFPSENQMAAFQQNSMMQNQYAMMAKYYSSFQNSAQAAQYKLYMQQYQQKMMNSNSSMNIAQTQQAQMYWAQYMKNMNVQRQAYQNLAAGSTGNTAENSNPAQAQVQAQAQSQAINNYNMMQFFKDQNKSQEVENKPQQIQTQPQPQPQVQMRNTTTMADLAAKGINININGKMQSEKQSNKTALEEPEYKTSKNHSSDFPEEDKTTMISPTSFQVQDTNKIEGNAPVPPLFDDFSFDINMANLDKFFDTDGLGDFTVPQDTNQNDDKKAQEPVVAAKKGRGRPKKEEQAQEPKNNKETKTKEEKKTNKKKAKEDTKEDQAFTMADGFFNPTNQMPFTQAGGAQGFLENQFEMASFPPHSMNEISSVQKIQTQKDSKEKISLLENNNSMNSLVREQPEFTNSNSISMMYPGHHQQQQQTNDLFENFEFDFQDTEDFDFDDGTFLFEPFDETKQGDELESTTEATSQPVRKRGRPRKYAPDGSLLIQDGSGQVRPAIKKTSKLQAEREAYEKYLEELKKPYKIHIHHDEADPQQKVNLTRVGAEHQLYVPPFIGQHQSLAKKKNLSPLWAPDMATQEFLDSYLRRLEAVVGQKINHQGAALKVLKIYNMRVDDVLENVKISPKYYQNYFKVNQRSAKNRFSH